MPLGFTNGAYNRASGTRDAFGGLSDALVREGHPQMVSRSGDREYADQLRIWDERMVLYPDINGRKVFGKKLWRGKTWYRIHPDVVAAPQDPPVSNHGKRRSNDLTYPYNNRNTAAHKRARQLAPNYGITWEGANFNEDWHWTFWGNLGTIGADMDTNTGGTVAGNETEDDMTPEERQMLKETHSMLLEVRDYLGANGGHKTKTLDTIGHKVTEIRDYLGAGGAKGNRNEDTIGHKINQMFTRWAKGDKG